MSRYVILLHEMPAGHQRATHWDLMFERDGLLRTWALPCEPAIGLDCQAEQLADHRIDYLEYEGPVSGGRGAVRRWDAGQYRIERASETEWSVVLSGARLQACLKLAREDAVSHSWRVALSAAPTRG